MRVLVTEPQVGRDTFQWALLPWVLLFYFPMLMLSKAPTALIALVAKFWHTMTYAQRRIVQIIVFSALGFFVAGLSVHEYYDVTLDRAMQIAGIAAFITILASLAMLQRR